MLQSKRQLQSQHHSGMTLRHTTIARIRTSLPSRPMPQQWSSGIWKR